MKFVGRASLNMLPGGVVFAISFLVFFFTVSPTVSFWDSGEFIASAAFLQIPHPPGAPLYLLTARLFSLFAGEPSTVAFFINLVSVTASAAAVWLVYKVLKIILLLIEPDAKSQSGLLTEAASMLGALLFAFTDTFWFSATEAEVYSLSIFFSALTLWIFLKWFTLPPADLVQSRWFFLGIYLLGLSMGVHLLNLLLVPAFALLFGWKTWGSTLKVTLWSLVFGFFTLALLYWGLVRNGLWVAKHLELWLVNGMGLFQHSGVLLWLLVLLGLLGSGLWYSHMRHPKLHFVLVAVTLLLFGWSSYFMIPVRASAATPINMNNPDNVFSLENYINRQQYGERPLLFGVSGWAQPRGWTRNFDWAFDDEKEMYVQQFTGMQPHFSRNDYVWFPRLYSREAEHKSGYEWWLGNSGERLTSPGFTDEVNFFLRYQMGHMYLRYLFWNFVGRQNGEQGHGTLRSGNWASGITVVDRYFLGSREWPLPTELYSAARNHYYGIPLLLAILGFMLLLRRGVNRRSLLFLLTTLFLLTGPLIVLYLNQPPYEPRERDYIFAGSFLMTALLAGIGIHGILRGIAHRGNSRFTTGLMVVLLALAGPGLLFSTNLNDHNRSHRYLARDLAISQLRSCPPNAILFTYGDNDTYPLWYAQQVEGVRSDVRLVNLGLLNTAWYVSQQLNALPGTPGLRTILPPAFYRKQGGTLFRVSTVDASQKDARLIFKSLKASGAGDEETEEMVTGTLPRLLQMKLGDEDTLQWMVTQDYLTPGDLALIDIIVANGALRPICFTRNTDLQTLGGLEHKLAEQGLVWQISSSGNSHEQTSDINHQLELFTNKISVGRDRETWWDNTCRQALENSEYRDFTITLAENLIRQKRYTDAGDVLKKSIREWPLSPFQSYDKMLTITQLLYDSGDFKECKRYVESVYDWVIEELFFYYHSGYPEKQIENEYCPLFRRIRNQALLLENNELLLRMEQELAGMCAF